MNRNTTTGMVTITAHDLTSSTDLAAVQAALVVGTPVKVFGVPQADGTVKAYTLMYFTGKLPRDAS